MATPSHVPPLPGMGNRWTVPVGVCLCDRDAAKSDGSVSVVGDLPVIFVFSLPCENGRSRREGAAGAFLRNIAPSLMRHAMLGCLMPVSPMSYNQHQFHDGMPAQVLNNGQCSQDFQVINGVKQSCVLAPVLFKHDVLNPVVTCLQ
ncbi:uncharacterized protein ACOB8E_018787 isoform 1-T1 [Sarcophilus harrisii]